MKMKAAVLSELGLSAPYASSRPLAIEEVDLLGPGQDEVLIRIETAGVCHSDLSIIEGVRQRPLPMVIGHEASGVVEEVGRGVGDLKKGDHVVSVFVASCGHCRPCATGRPALCEPGAAAAGAGTLLCGEHKLFKDGRPLYHHSGVSAFAQYATVSRFSLVKVDHEVPLEVAALFGCAVLTGIGGAINGANIKLGMKVAVIGLGGVGLAAVLGVLAAGAEQVVAIDLSKEKLAFARELGATDVFNAADPNVAEAVRDATDGGVEVALEFAGAAKALELGYKITRRGGQLVTAGLPHPSTMLSISAASLVAEEKSIKGSYLGSSVPVRDLPNFINLYKRGRLPIDRLITHKGGLEDLNLAMDRLKNGQAIRQLIFPHL